MVFYHRFEHVILTIDALQVQQSKLPVFDEQRVQSESQSSHFRLQKDFEKVVLSVALFMKMKIFFYL